MDVPQAFEEIAVFNHSKKCSLSSGDFRRKTGIFCAAVVNKKGFSAVQKSHRCNQRRTPPAAQKLRRNSQRATALFFLYFLAVFSGFLSILIPFLTSCGSYLPCVPHLSVAFYVVKSKASPEQFRQGFAVFSASRFFLSVSNAKTAPKPPHAVGCYNQR